MSDDINPKCEKCGDVITGGASIFCCRYATECAMWPHSDGSPSGDGAELLMAQLWMGNALDQIALQIAERERLEARLRDEEERHALLQSRCYEGFASATDGIFDALREQDERVVALREVAASLRRRGKALEESGDDFMEPLGAHYLAIAGEIEQAMNPQSSQGHGHG